MVSVPAATPVTRPDVLMVAMLVLDEDQAPPEAVSVKVLVAAGQRLATPPMAPALGNGLTVMA